ALPRNPPRGGPAFRRILRHARPPGQPAPCDRPLHRWLQQAALGPAPAGRRPASVTPRATRPHEVWQVDAAERIPLQSGQRVSWLRIIDECSGAVLWTRVFPPRQMAQGPAHRGPGGTPPGLPALGGGGCRTRCAWTTAGPGAPTAIGRRTWACGSWAAASTYTTTTRTRPPRMPWWNARNGRANAGATQRTAAPWRSWRRTCATPTT